ncbi:MAG TPA: efflux transporter periplasmic adaptor subunit [Advenella kashmirensis]|uniref:Efflux transporter periplasmic adaptor subunit n=1 Tax=Advenella kashmirensis TaxID=310575 RepID=A0A356LMF0_9BURK|nr:efflux transporter periplasmic adaptor subunit [Advenella kashmirensis]
MAPPSVSVAQVALQDVRLWDDYNGRINAVETVKLRPRVSGYIERVTFTEGKEVHKGDVLFVIDARSYRTVLAQAKAQLARARAHASQSASEAKRAQVLVAQRAVSTEMYEQRRTAAAVAQTDAQAAEAAVSAALLNVEWTQVRAPISGLAGRAEVTAGNLVSADDAGSVLTTLVSQDKVHVYFNADESAFLHYAQMTRNGRRGSEQDGKLPVQVGLSDEDGFPHRGTVDFLDNQVDSNTGTIRMRAVLDNKDGALTPGLFARVRLLGSGQFDALLINDKAVLTDQDRKYVWIVDENGKAQRHDVKLGRKANGLRIVESGLVPGDKVIVDGVDKVYMPGLPVDAKAVPMQPIAANVAKN